MNLIEILKMVMSKTIGNPYIWGGNGLIEGQDCSGYAQELLASVGLDKRGDQRAVDLYDHFLSDSRLSLTDNPSFGDLVFFGKSSVVHIGMAINSKLMIEAGGGGSKTTTRADAIRDNAYVRIRPINNRGDLYGIINLSVLINE